MPAAEFIPSIHAPFARLHAAIPTLVHVAYWLRIGFTYDKHRIVHDRR